MASYWRVLPLLLCGLLCRSGAQDRATTFTAVIRDPAGYPIESATARLSSLHRVFQVKCTADGAARFIDLVPGTYDLEVFARGFHSQTVRDIRMPRTASGPFEITMYVADTGSLCGSPNSVDYKNSEAPRIPLSGHLREADEDKPLDGARVDLLEATKKRVIASAQSDKIGNFVLQGVPAGRYDVRVTKDAYWKTWVKGFLVPEESSTTLTIFVDKRDHIHVCQ